MNKKFSKMVIVVALLATSSLYAPVFANNLAVSDGTTVAMDQSQVLLPTIKIKGETLIPLRAYLNLVGIEKITWEPVHTLGTYAKVIIEAPAYFIQGYHGSLERGLGNIYGDTIAPLPKVLENIVDETKETPATAHTSLQDKALDIIINSEGSSDEYAFYNYANVNDTLYVMPTGLEALGFVGLEPIDDTQAMVTFRTQEQIKQSYQAMDVKLQEALKKLTPDEVITTWIRAQQSRCGALQYALFSPDLQAKVLPEVKERGWVTGGSSPTLRGGKVVAEQVSNTTDHMTYKLQLESMLQGKVYEKLEQIVTLGKRDDRWYITSVEGATGYYTYSQLDR